MASLVDVQKWPDYSRAPIPPNATTMLNAVSSAVRRHCGWSISQETVTDQKFDTDGSDLLLLPTLYLTAIAEIELQGVVLTPDTDYIWSATGKVRRLPRGTFWPDAYGSAIVTWTHGYAVTPEDLQAFIVGKVAEMSGSKPGLIEEQVGGIRTRYSESGVTITLTGTDEDFLDYYTLAKRA